MRAIKGNKVYTIDEGSKANFIKEGYDILDDNGNIIAHGAGKTVSMDKYSELEEKYNSLNARCKELEIENENYKLSIMTVEQLKAYAAEQGIDLEEATTKDAILEKIKESQGK